VQQLRKQRHLSQADLADATGLSVAYISHIETGIKKASLESIVRIANALGVTVDQILNGNQTGNQHEYQSELNELIKDCSGYERGIIHDIATAVKTSLRNHADLVIREGDLEDI
jgi:transcriptional regulator with XRE-family HTH domain